MHLDVEEPNPYRPISARYILILHVVALLFPKLLTAHNLHAELPASIKFPVMELKISRFS